MFFRVWGFRLLVIGWRVDDSGFKILVLNV